MAAALDAYVDKSVAGVDHPEFRAHYHRPDSCHENFATFVLAMKTNFAEKKRAFILKALENCIKERTERNAAIVAQRKHEPTKKELADDEEHVRIIGMFKTLRQEFDTIKSAKLPDYRFYFFREGGKACIGIYPDIAPADKQGAVAEFQDPKRAARAAAGEGADEEEDAPAAKGRYDVLNEETAKDKAAREKREKAQQAYEATLAKWNSDAAVTARRKTWESKRNQAKTSEQLALFEQRNGEDFDPDKGKPEPPKPGGRRRTRRKNGRRRTQKKRKTYV